MYSPADRPSSTRAAPEKNRIWSIIGGISSDRVRATGLPVLPALGIDELIGARFEGISDADEGKAALGRRGVAPPGEGGRGCSHGRVDILRPGHRGLEVGLARARIDDGCRRSVGRLDGSAADEVGEPEVPAAGFLRVVAAHGSLPCRRPRRKPGGWK